MTLTLSLDRCYEILEPLGRGGFGTVYRARYLGEGDFAKEVALKVLRSDVDAPEEVASRLRDEARMLAMLRHRAIVQVDQLTRLQDRWAVVMEYVEGVDLGRLLSRGPLPQGCALEVAAEVAGALHAAWTGRNPEGGALELLHRDIKPSNLRLTARGEVKVLDLGIARARFDSREAHTRSLALGTPSYMAPERFELTDGPEGDVYALGVVLYEMLTGRRLGRTWVSRRRHQGVIDEAMEALDDAVLPQVRALVEGMLAWRPSDRPTARDVEWITLTLARRCDDPPLRFWAERAVLHEARQERESSANAADREGLVGSILVAQSTPTRAEPRPPTRRAPPRRWWWSPRTRHSRSLSASCPSTPWRRRLPRADAARCGGWRPPRCSQASPWVTPPPGPGSPRRCPRS
ncbi:MAG: serine/threonine protein kinase [Alphaproteobacteria bacterium]|nr:serine/threonine protein kinase [Alphaproteobacteria bacterium]